MKVFVIIIGLWAYGQVQDEKENLAGVKVSTSNKETYTDLDGFFQIEVNPYDSITFNMISYREIKWPQ